MNSRYKCAQVVRLVTETCETRIKRFTIPAADPDRELLHQGSLPLGSLCLASE